MPKRRPYDSASVDALLARQAQVARHRQLTDLGVPIPTVIARMRPEGPWQWLLPGVVVTHRGTPTQRQRLVGALLFAGPGARLTGHSVLALHGVRAAQREAGQRVHVVIPADRHRKSHGYALIERSRRMDDETRLQALPATSVARALVDAARTLHRPGAVRELTAEVIQSGLCSVAELRREVLAAARQRTASIRRVLEEIGAGVRSVAEAKARRALAAAGVPTPQWNVALWTAYGEFIGIPDAYWAHVVAALQIDSMRWHLGPAQYQRTQHRQRQLTLHGVLTLPIAPTFILNDEERFVREVVDFLAAAAARAVPSDVVVGPHPHAA